jgi:hypothetical protein
MNYLGISCLQTADGKELDSRVSALEAVDGKLLDDRVDSLEAATSNIENAARTSVTTVSGSLVAENVFGKNLIGPMLSFAGRPVTGDVIQYFNMDAPIQTAFRSVLGEGAVDSHHNFFIAPFNCTVPVLSWSRIPWGPDDPLENGRNNVQFEIDGVLTGGQVVINGVRDYEELRGVNISVGQTVALRYVVDSYPYWKSIGQIRMFACLQPAGKRSTI